MDAPSMHLVEALLAREDATGARHVLWEGRVREMVGGTANHELLSLHLCHQLLNELSEQYEVFSSNMRLAVPAAGGLVYPDAAIAVEPKFGKPVDTLLNPIAICEVLSKSTKVFDRGEKFRAYRAIKSIRHYVLVSQTDVRVEVFTRTAGGKWPLKSYGAGERVLLPALQSGFEIDALYKRIKFK